MKLSTKILEQRAFVERSLGDSIICQQCGAGLKTYATRCAADLSDICDGYIAIEAAKAKFWLLPKAETNG